LNGPPGPFAEIVAAKHFTAIPKSRKRDLGQEIKSIIGIEPWHWD